MKRTGHYASYSVAARPVTHALHHLCEPLEARRLLAGEPVLVLVEQVLHNQTHNTIGLVEPWVLNTTAEVEWNLGQFAQNPPPWQGLTDADGNGYAGDAYGWNFTNNTPSFITGIEDDDSQHGRVVTESAVDVFDYAEAEAVIGQGDVKVMYVVTTNLLIFQGVRCGPW